MKLSNRYEKIALWLEKKVVSERDLFEANFSYEELDFITNFNKRKIWNHRPDLIKYFEGRIINEYF